MPICIYCRQDESKVTFDKVEHVIPQSFGTFGPQTPVLNCVCDDCNGYFGKTLDNYFARESLEGISRYQRGIHSSEDRVQRHIVIQLPDDPELGIFAKTRVYIDGTTGEVAPLTYVRLKNIETGEEIYVLRKEMDSFDPAPWTKVKAALEIRANDATEHGELVAKLKAMGFTQTFGEMKTLPSEVLLRKQPPVEITGQINRIFRRAVTKILVNFSARYIGPDEVLKHSWGKARRFARYDEGEIEMKTRNGPFWDTESEEMRHESTGYNIIVQNAGGDVAGSLEFFNLMVHDVTLCQGYNIKDERAVGYRFVPNEEPQQAIKIPKF